VDKERSLLVYGGFAKGGNTPEEVSFPCGLSVCNMTTFCWSDVNVSHGYPAPRFGHCLVTSSYFDTQEEFRKKKGLSRDEDDESAGGRSDNLWGSGSRGGGGGGGQLQSQSGGVDVGLASGVVIFGGMNSLYTNPDLWHLDCRLIEQLRDAADAPPGSRMSVEIAPIDSQRPSPSSPSIWPSKDMDLAEHPHSPAVSGKGASGSSMQAAWSLSALDRDKTAFTSPDRGGGGGGGGGGVEAARQKRVEKFLMEKKKEVVAMEQRLILARGENGKIQAEADKWKTQYNKMVEVMARQEEQAAAEASELRKALEDAVEAQRSTEEDNRELMMIMASMDMCSRLREESNLSRSTTFQSSSQSNMHPLHEQASVASTQLSSSSLLGDGGGMGMGGMRSRPESASSTATWVQGGGGSRPQSAASATSMGRPGSASSLNVM
jgi:hypothetical protein